MAWEQLRGRRPPSARFGPLDRKWWIAIGLGIVTLVILFAVLGARPKGSDPTVRVTVSSQREGALVPNSDYLFNEPVTQPIEGGEGEATPAPGSQPARRDSNGGKIIAGFVLVLAWAVVGFEIIRTERRGKRVHRASPSDT